MRIGHGRALAAELEIGASLAVSGVCLTVVALGEQHGGDGGGAGDGIGTWASQVELSPETLARTTLGALAAGAAVNLEPALRLGDPLGGHWVQGHVDAVLEVLARRDLEAHRELEVALPPAFRQLVVEKGSVTLDGVSLTVASLAEDRFSVALIPHTLEVTTLGALAPGDRVNFEADVLAKYVQRSLAPYRPDDGG